MKFLSTLIGLIIAIFIYLLTMWHVGSSPIKYRTQFSRSGSMESQLLGHQGSPITICEFVHCIMSRQITEFVMHSRSDAKVCYLLP